MDDAQSSRWRDVAAVLHANGSWRPGTEALLRLYCIAVCEAADARERLVNEGAVLMARSGTYYVNPERTIAAEAEAAAARLAKMLGLVPGPRRG